MLLKLNGDQVLGDEVMGKAVLAAKQLHNLLKKEKFDGLDNVQVEAVKSELEKLDLRIVNINISHSTVRKMHRLYIGRQFPR
jgi:hypothetical protein